MLLPIHEIKANWIGTGGRRRRRRKSRKGGGDRGRPPRFRHHCRSWLQRHGFLLLPVSFPSTCSSLAPSPPPFPTPSKCHSIGHVPLRKAKYRFIDSRLTLPPSSFLKAFLMEVIQVVLSLSPSFLFSRDPGTVCYRFYDYPFMITRSVFCDRACIPIFFFFFSTER